MSSLLLLPSISRGSVPDEAGPRVAASVAEVDDQGEVAVVDGDLGETNDASDALLLAVSLLAGYPCGVGPGLMHKATYLGLLGKLQPGHCRVCGVLVVVLFGE